MLFSLCLSICTLRNFISNIIQWLACCCNAKREHNKDLVSTLFAICKCWITVDLSVVGGCYGYAFTRFSLGNRVIFFSECVCAPFCSFAFYIKFLDQHFFWIKVIICKIRNTLCTQPKYTDRTINTSLTEITLCETLENPKYDRQIWLEWWPSLFFLHDYNYGIGISILTNYSSLPHRPHVCMRSEHLATLVT